MWEALKTDEEAERLMVFFSPFKHGSCEKQHTTRNSISVDGEDEGANAACEACFSKHRVATKPHAHHDHSHVHLRPTPHCGSVFRHLSLSPSSLPTHSNNKITSKSHTTPSPTLFFWTHKN